MAKNIILLSDGTGNSSAQLLKTNVWRLYESLQLTDATVQVACYDDGVGTSSFKPLAVLGGGIGVGLRRNVLRLYRFLCEHYDPGDQIYLFGFSRGAFTVRVLAGLICSQGIIRTRPTLPVEGATEMAEGDGPAAAPASAEAVAAAMTPSKEYAYGSELVRLVSWAYREFRKEFNQTGGLVTAARWLRDIVFRTFQAARGHAAYDQRQNHQDVKIAFIGVWDTVDAYGLPVDELTDGIDHWIWPLSMPDLRLHKNVARACHALALDDERNTFHPVLWDESEEPQNAQHIQDERITQVWFAGMHSNVGGGYPDDALSAVPLAWMTKQLEGKLHFVPHLLAYHTAKADPLGRIYDSRRGLKGYYRYNPRGIEYLTNGQKHEQAFFRETWPKPRSPVTIGRPKIHESVFTRMSAAPEAYTPFVFPERYAVVMEDGRILDGDENPYEPTAPAKKRVAAQEAVWDVVWRRRIAYFTAVAITVVLFLYLPFREGAREGAVVLGTPGAIVVAVGDWLPTYASPWIDYFKRHPWELFGGVAALLLLSRIGRGQQARMCRLMRGIWLKVIPPAGNQFQQLGPHTSTLKSLRSSKAYQGFFAVLRRRILPNVTGIVALVALVAVGNRVAFEAVNATGALCDSGRARGAATLRTLQIGDRTERLEMVSDRFCNPTGVELLAGKRYQFEFAPGSEWRDGGVQVGYSAKGFASDTPGLTFTQRAVFAAFLPFRRVWLANWFTPIARIGRAGMDQFPLDEEVSTITADTSGELMLFANDAIWPINVNPLAFGWDAYYVNNQGTATVTVTRLPDREESQPDPGRRDASAALSSR